MSTCTSCSNDYVNCVCSVQNITVQVPTPISVTVASGIGGARGIQGIQGPAGAAGDPGAIAYYHVQNSSSAIWTIAHNLNFYPNITTMDSSGSVVEGEIEHLNRNTLRVTFLAAFSGEAFLS